MQKASNGKCCYPTPVETLCRQENPPACRRWRGRCRHSLVNEGAHGMTRGGSSLFNMTIICQGQRTFSHSGMTEGVRGMIDGGGQGSHPASRGITILGLLGFEGSFSRGRKGMLTNQLPPHINRHMLRSLGDRVEWVTNDLAKEMLHL